MKTNWILGLTVASAFFAACSNDETVDVQTGDAIAFRTLVDASTRANQATVTSLTSFNVTALRATGVEFSTTVTKEGAAWKTGGVYYWPSYDLTFYAYANGPATGKGTVTVNGTTKAITGFTPEANVVQHKDLLVAYQTGNKATYNNTPVPLVFKHALSQVAIQAKNLKASSIKIEVIGVKLVNMATKADLAFPTSALAANVKLPAANWSNLADRDMPEKAYYSNGTKAVTLTGTLQSVMFGDNNFMLIPQQLTAWTGKSDTEENKKGAYLAVLCRIYNVSDAGDILVFPAPTAGDNKDGKYAYAAVPIDTNWEPGKKYVYNLTFCADGGGAGVIDPNPQNPGGGENTDPNPGTGGETILGGPITFTVNIDDWEEAPVKEINM